MRKILLSMFFLSLFLIACGGSKEEVRVNTSDTKSREEPVQEDSNVLTNEEKSENETASIPFFYQNVGPFTNGASTNAVRAGISEDGIVVKSYGVDVLDWQLSMQNTNQYGDPVFSYISNGMWAMTARASRGPSALVYGESNCPVIDDSKVVSLGVSSASGCKKMNAVNGGKTSQIFEYEGANYILHMIAGELYLANVSDATSLSSMCISSSPVSNVGDLDSGDSTLVISAADADGLVLSDAAIARREDGTWVLFVKGIPKTSMGPDCPGNSLCELCARAIYRTTSKDLINWSSLEKIVAESSIPEAITMPDGKVRLYWQDFSDTCDAQDQSVASYAPISTAYEMEGNNELSEPEQVSFPDEDFEGNNKIHYATNGNPIWFTNEEAVKDLQACMQ